MHLGPWGQDAKEGFLEESCRGSTLAVGPAASRAPRWERSVLAELTGPWPRCRARYLFLFDKVVIVCKRRGYSYELKEVIELLCHKMTDDPMNNKDIKKVGLASRSEGRATAGGAGGHLQAGQAAFSS